MSEDSSINIVDATQASAQRWREIEQVEGWAGELRVNMIRVLAIAVFYARHLMEFLLSPQDSPQRGSYHARVTWLCLTWTGMALVLHLRLVRRHVTSVLKYVVVTWDAAAITVLCMLAGGPKSPLLLLYFPLVATAPLRASLRLVCFTTACAILGYLCVLGCYVKYVIGIQRYYSTPELRIPRSHEAIVVMALLLSGFLAGQFVRQAKRIAGGHHLTAAMPGQASRPVGG